MSRPMSRLSSLEARRKLLASAAALQREQIAKSWGQLCEVGRATWDSAQQDMAGVGKFAATTAGIWTVMRLFRRRPRASAPKRPRGGLLPRAMGMFRIVRHLWDSVLGVRANSRSEDRAGKNPTGEATNSSSQKPFSSFQSSSSQRKA